MHISQIGTKIAWNYHLMLYSKYHLLRYDPATSERWPQNFNRLLQPRTLKIWQSAKQIVDVLQYLYLLLRLTAGRGSEADQLKLVASCIILSSFNQGNILTWHKHKYNGISEYRYDWCWNVGCLLLVTGQSWTQAAFITLYKQIRLDFHSQLSWIPSNFLLRTKQRNLQTITPSLVAGQAKLDVLLSSFPSF